MSVSEREGLERSWSRVGGCAVSIPGQCTNFVESVKWVFGNWSSCVIGRCKGYDHIVDHEQKEQFRDELDQANSLTSK